MTTTMDLSTLQAMKAQLEHEVREAEAGLRARTLAAQSRYANALYELDRVEHLLQRAMYRESRTEPRIH